MFQIQPSISFEQEYLSSSTGSTGTRHIFILCPSPSILFYSIRIFAPGSFVCSLVRSLHLSPTFSKPLIPYYTNLTTFNSESPFSSSAGEASSMYPPASIRFFHFVLSSRAQTRVIRRIASSGFGEEEEGGSGMHVQRPKA